MLQCSGSSSRIFPSAAPELAVLGPIFTGATGSGRSSQPEQDVVDERDGQRDEHAKYDPAIQTENGERQVLYFRENRIYSC